MQSVSFVSGAGFQLVLPSGSRSWDGTPLRPERILAAGLQRWQDDIETLYPLIAVKDPYISILYPCNL